MSRRHYSVDITVNGLKVETVAIDPHYEIKHSATVTDALILKLVALLDGGDFTPEAEDKGFEYYVTDGLVASGKQYKLVWLLDTKQQIVGVINAYRR